jgi:aryl-alcohol dehydrogenase-like predicted oxidoreductase
MTFGEQNTPEEAFAQMDFATERGINFFDTAELYPVPPRANTYARTEEIIGDWLAERGGREKIVLATKAAGPGWKHIRPGPLVYRPEQLRSALDASLKRLKTDYIDLYQLHWPERSANIFGRLGYQHRDNENFVPFDDILCALADEISAGRIRAIGVSNETPWGVMQFLARADAAGLPRIASIQNPYNLLNRTFEVGLAEIAIREKCGLLAYSPLAFGVLSGKYLNGAKPPGGRLTVFSEFQRYAKERAGEATRHYADLALEYGLRPAQMALAYVYAQPFVTSTIIGATSLDQLEENIGAFDLSLDDPIFKDIEQIHEGNSNPAP